MVDRRRDDAAAVILVPQGDPPVLHPGAAQLWLWGGGGRQAVARAHNNQPTNGSDMAVEMAFAAVAAATAAAVAAAVATAAMVATVATAAGHTAAAATAAREIFLRGDVQNITLVKVTF